MEDAKAFTLKFGGKNLWLDYHRRFLDNDNQCKRNKYGFRKNAIENDEVPSRLNSH